MAAASSASPASSDSRDPAAVVCQWFALCDNPATHDEPHPILGTVPTCDRCGEWIVANK
jgi:hypothetical protein